MLETAAVLLVLVGAMHSFAGGPRLITPLLRQKGFPVILGSQRNGRVTLWFGWHALTLFWWALAAVLLTMSVDQDAAGPALLISLAFACGICGLAAIVATRGRHLSWVLFLLLAAILGGTFFT